MGLFTYTLAGGGFIAIGAWESLIASLQPQPTTKTTPSSHSPSPSSSSSSSSITLIATSLFSLAFISNSLISLLSALDSKDDVGLVLQLEVIAIASLFFLYSVFGLLTHFTNSIALPSSILNLLCLFGFVEEFVLFYLQRKDPSGIENHYFDLLLVPIGICVVSTVLELKTNPYRFSRLGRGIGLISQGSWFLQMGFSFYSSALAHGCFLSEKSRGNFTVKCKGHPEYHRGRAIGTLQFNCHLAFLVVVVVGVYSVVCRKVGVGGESTLYRPLGAEMQQLDSHHGQFTLDSDDENENGNGMKEEGNVGEQNAVVVVPELGINGYGSL